MKTFKDFLNEGYNWGSVNIHFNPIMKAHGFDNMSRIADEIQKAVPKPKYIRKMTEFFAKGQIHRIEDIGTTAKEVFGRYHFLKGRNALIGDHNNIDKVKSFNDLRDIVDSPSYAHLQEPKKTNAEARREAQSDFSTPLENSEMTVQIPHNVEASSRGARCSVSNKKAAWCTAIENDPETFEQYSIQSGGLHQIIPKNPTHPGERYQWSPYRPTGNNEYKNHGDPELKDENDEDVDTETFLKRFPNSGFSSILAFKGASVTYLHHSKLTPESDARVDRFVDKALSKPEISTGEAQGIFSTSSDPEKLKLAVSKLKADPNTPYNYHHPLYNTVDFMSMTGHNPNNQQHDVNALLDRIEAGHFHPSMVNAFASTARGEPLKRLATGPLNQHLTNDNKGIVAKRYAHPSEASVGYTNNIMITGDKVETPNGEGHLIGLHNMYRFHAPHLPEDSFNPNFDKETTADVFYPHNGTVKTHSTNDLKLTHSYEEFEDIPREVQNHMDGFLKKWTKPQTTEELSTAKYSTPPGKAHNRTDLDYEMPLNKNFDRSVPDEGVYNVGHKVRSRVLGEGRVIAAIGNLHMVDWGDNIASIHDHTELESAEDGKIHSSLREEVVNAVGGGAIAGAGVPAGPGKGEPGVSKKKQRQLNGKNGEEVLHILRRALINNG